MSLDYNRVVLVGRATKDIESKEVGDNLKGAFVVAVNRKISKSSDVMCTDFIPVVVWGNYAKVLGSYVTKGKHLLIEGSIQVREYENSKKEKAWFTQVVASKVQVFSRESRFQQDKSQESSESSLQAVAWIL